MIDDLQSGRDELASQMLRYAVSGCALAALYALTCWSAAELLGAPAQLANALGFAAALVAGFILHSRWSFGGVWQAQDRGTARARFLIVNLAGYLLNVFWMWAIVDRGGGTVANGLIPVTLVTPAFTFWLNRCWTFGRGA